VGAFQTDVAIVERWVLDKMNSKITNNKRHNRVIFRKLTVPQLVKKFLTFMEPKSSLSCSQSPLLVSVLSKKNPVQALQSDFFKTHSNIIFPPSYRFPSGRLLTGFPTKTPYAYLFSTLRATCSVNRILLSTLLAATKEVNYFELTCFLLGIVWRNHQLNTQSESPNSISNSYLEFIFHE
jgi:hypothetical protein